MLNSVPTFASGKRWFRSFRAWVLVATLATAANSLGCGGGSVSVPQPKTVAHLQTLAVLYGQYTGENKGQSPPDEATFKKFIKGLPPERLMGNTAEEIFISPRDSQPYTVLYAVKMGMPGAGPPPLVAYEQTGVGGKRYVATALGGVEEVDDARFQTMKSQK